MELLMMTIVVIILILLILYFNKNFECFNNNDDKQKALNLINEIRELYDLLMRENNELSKDLIKSKIKNNIKEIEVLLSNDYDKYKLNNIYENELIPILSNKFSTVNENKFEIIINNIIFIINYSTNSYYYNHFIIINDIKDNFKKLNDLYRDLYITKIYNYETIIDFINNYNKNIYNGFLKLTTNEDLNSSGINLILNTTLKLAYMSNDLTSINSQINTVNEKLRMLKIKIDNDNKKKKEEENNDPKIIQAFQDEFDKIYNYFDIINYIYKNNINLNEITNINNKIYRSINNIIELYNKNEKFKVRVLTIKTVIISPVLEIELQQSYKTKDKNQIIKTKNKFYSGMIDIKNAIIEFYIKVNPQF